jgi:hypothetical protein
MASINYGREWQRIAERLQWSVLRLNNQLEAAETDEEREALNTKLELVKTQLTRARSEAQRYALKQQGKA